MQRKDIKNELKAIIDEPGYKPHKFHDFADELGLKKKKDKKILGEILDRLVDKDILIKNYQKKFEHPAYKTITGTLQGNTRGFGFVIPDGDLFQKDIYIGSRNLGGAFDSDKVKVEVFTNPEDDRPEGRIVDILERGRNNVVGQFQRSKDYGFVVADNDKLNKDIFVGSGNFMNATNGDKVVVEVTKWPEDGRNPEGKIIEVLGKPDDPGVDILSVFKEYQAPTVFPPEVTDQADAMSSEITEEDMKGRLDLRDLTTFTIDGDSSKDFDDAVSIEKISDDVYRLGVHIADVSHYVKEDTPIDVEAANRATSIYTVNKVVPMLPFNLSNNLCSLRPEEDRLTISCIMDVDKHGKVLSYKIQRSVIHSKARMTYSTVNEFLAGEDTERTAYLKPFKKDLETMQEFAKILNKERRQARGSIDFEYPESVVVVDEEGKPVEIKISERGVSERLIEEFMLLANETVAEYASKSGLTFMYRNHPHPDAEKLKEFRDYLKRFGFHLGKEGQIPNNHDFQKLMKDIEHSPNREVITLLALRTMQQALYQPENQGHYALGAENYTHFTSPIRRYPDLTVHRNIGLLADTGGDVPEKEKRRIARKLKDEAAHSSEQERVADNIERDVKKMKIAEYMTGHIGEVFNGKISGVTGFGFFVELPNTVEGLVKMTALNDDYYIYDEGLHRLVGQRFGKIYELGQPIKVKTVGADKMARQVDFEVIE
ncbi:MAG: ribonuclease R [Eubacteriaceae bacterium]